MNLTAVFQAAPEGGYIERLKDNQRTATRKDGGFAAKRRVCQLTPPRANNLNYITNSMDTSVKSNL